MQIFDYWMTALKWISWSKLLRQRRGGLTGKQCSRRGGGVIEPLEVRRLLSTLTVNASGGANFSDLSDAIVAAHNGDTILVSPGTYTAIGTVVDSQPIYYINKALTIQSTNGAGNTILSITGGQNVGIWITASNVTINGFTVNGGDFGVQVTSQDSTTLNNIDVSNLIVHPDISAASSATNGHGIYFYNVANSAIEGCNVGPSQDNGIFIDGGSTNDLVMNNHINGTVVQHAIAIKDSNYIEVLNNTVTSSAFDGVILVGSSYCRITGNNISGHKYDGITLTSDVISTTSTLYSDFNYLGDNTVVSDGHQNGVTDGTGIWLNDDSDGNTVFGNTLSGSPENGIAIFVSSDNLIQGNVIFNEWEGGIFIWNVPVGDPTGSIGNQPTNNVLEGNYIYDCPVNSGINLRGAASTQISNNMVVGNYTGVTGSNNAGGIIVQTSGNTTIWSNVFMDLWQGFYIYGDSTNTSAFQNRTIGCGHNYCYQPATINWDAGPTLGGNYWSGFAAAGNPSATTPFTGFVYTGNGSTGGGFVDHYPYQSESLGQPYTATVTAPVAGTIIAAGSTITIAWQSTASVCVDLDYHSSETGYVLIASDVPNTGYYNWTLPGNLAPGSDYAIIVTPKDSTQTIQGTAGVSSGFTVDPADLNLLSPGNGSRGVGGGTMLVAWADTVATTPVNVQIQLNGGAWQTLASNVTTDFTNVTLPNTASNQAQIRVVDAASGYISTQNGYFNLQATAAVAITPGGSPLLIGSVHSLTWTSPANSQTVNIDLYNGSTWQTIVHGLPDNGSYTWFVPDYPVASNTAAIYLTYFNSDSYGGQNQLAQASTSPFSIAYRGATTLTVVSPNGGETWLTGTSHNVTWSISGDTSAISSESVALSTNDGVSYTVLASGLSAATRSYSFTPDSSQVGNTTLIQVQALNSLGAVVTEAVSNNTFIINNPLPVVRLISPNGGETWATGTTCTVTWSISGNASVIASEAVALSTNDGGNFSYISPVLSASATSFSFTPVSSQAGNAALVQVLAFYGNGSVESSAISAGTFTIDNAFITPVLTVTSPTASQTWQTGTTCTVDWSISGNTSTIGSEVVALSTNGGGNFSLISSALGATARSFSFTPVSSQAGNATVIQVLALDSSGQNVVVSNTTGNFTILNTFITPTLSITSPTGGQTWEAGTDYTVNWSISGNTSTISSQVVALAVNGGAYTIISPALSATARSFSFVPDDTQAGTATIQVLALDAGGNVAASGASNSAFTIVSTTVPTISSIAPASGPAAGGSTVIILGTNLTSAAVDFGGLPASSVTVVSATRLSVIDPPQAAGTVDVTVITANGASAISTADQFTYAPAATQAVYRLYSPVTLEHFYTSDVNEYDYLKTLVGTWNDEGVAYSDYTGPATVDGVTDEPLYRLYDAPDKQHFWTTDFNEYNILRNAPWNWDDEGIAGYVFPTAVTSGQAMYRLRAPNVHLWTTSLNEYDTLATEGWTQEGIIGYVLS